MANPHHPDGHRVAWKVKSLWLRCPGCNATFRLRLREDKESVRPFEPGPRQTEPEPDV